MRFLELSFVLELGLNSSKMTKRYLLNFIWIAAAFTTCSAELNDGHYSEEDDAKVLPIVLPIVLVVVIVCIFACCWQGKKCPCNKNDNTKKKKQENEESNVGEYADNEKKHASRAIKNQPSARTNDHSQLPPDYSSLQVQRQKDLPGRTSVKQDSFSTNAETQYKKKSRHSSRSHATSGYDTEVSRGVRVDEKHRVIDNRSRHNYDGRQDTTQSFGKQTEYHKSYGNHGGARNASHQSRKQEYYGYR